MCKAIASSILGVDEDTPEAEQKSVDALKEILNMTCGNLTTDLAGEDEVENLTIPEVAELDRSGWEDLKEQAETVTVMADQFPVLVSLKLETP
jgi:CheY-specific phosphatase CheX